MSMDEQVLVVPSSLLDELGRFQGFCDDVQRYLPVLLGSERTEYRLRGEMEQDPSFKQLIPYVVFRHRGDDGAWRIFHYTRGSGQGEQRLHAKKSVGVGGHISLEDTQHPDVYLAGMQRELLEEVAFGAEQADDLFGGVTRVEDLSLESGAALRLKLLEGGMAGQPIGLINDDSNAVGQVHLGVMHVVDLHEPWVRAREKDLVDAGFSDRDTLRADWDRFETWSQIALEYLFRMAGSAVGAAGRAG